MGPQFIWICLFVLSRSYSGSSSAGSSCSGVTWSVGLAPGCPGSPESSGQILLLDLMMTMQQRLHPSSWSCQSFVAYFSLKCGLYEREYSVQFPQIQTAICLARASSTRMPGRVFFFFPHCRTEP